MEGKSYRFAFCLQALALLLWFSCCLGHAESSTHSNGRDQELRRRKGLVTWCIAKPSSGEQSLKNNINYSCGQKGVDCRPIQSGGSCFDPDTFLSHASFAMNLFYKSAGKHHWDCHFNGTGLVVTQDPSTDTCKYPA